MLFTGVCPSTGRGAGVTPSFPIGGTLTQVRIGGGTLGYPTLLHPSIQVRSQVRTGVVPPTETPQRGYTCSRTFLLAKVFTSSLTVRAAIQQEWELLGPCSKVHEMDTYEIGWKGLETRVLSYSFWKRRLQSNTLNIWEVLFSQASVHPRGGGQG